MNNKNEKLSIKNNVPAIAEKNGDSLLFGTERRRNRRNGMTLQATFEDENRIEFQTLLKLWTKKKVGQTTMDYWVI